MTMSGGVGYVNSSVGSGSDAGVGVSGTNIIGNGVGSSSSFSNYDTSLVFNMPNQLTTNDEDTQEFASSIPPPMNVIKQEQSEQVR